MVLRSQMAGLEAMVVMYTSKPQVDLTISTSYAEPILRVTTARVERDRNEMVHSANIFDTVYHLEQKSTK